MQYNLSTKLQHFIFVSFEFKERSDTVSVLPKCISVYHCALSFAYFVFFLLLLII